MNSEGSLIIERRKSCMRTDTCWIDLVGTEEISVSVLSMKVKVKGKVLEVWKKRGDTAVWCFSRRIREWMDQDCQKALKPILDIKDNSKRKIISVHRWHNHVCRKPLRFHQKRLELMSLTKLYDTKSHKNQLCVCSLTMNNSKRKLKQFHLQNIKNNKIYGDKHNQGGKRLVYSNYKKKKLLKEIKNNK